MMLSTNADPAGRHDALGQRNERSQTMVKEVEPDDPMALVGVVLDEDPDEETLEEMAWSQRLYTGPQLLSPSSNTKTNNPQS